MASLHFYLSPFKSIAELEKDSAIVKKKKKFSGFSLDLSDPRKRKEPSVTPKKAFKVLTNAPSIISSSYLVLVLFTSVSIVITTSTITTTFIITFFVSIVTSYSITSTVTSLISLL